MRPGQEQVRAQIGREISAVAREATRLMQVGGTEEEKDDLQFRKTRLLAAIEEDQRRSAAWALVELETWLRQTPVPVLAALGRAADDRDNQLSADMVDEILAGRDHRLEQACEEFRARYYPNRHRVGVALGVVFSVSGTGRVGLIFDSEREQPFPYTFDDEGDEQP